MTKKTFKPKIIFWGILALLASGVVSYVSEERALIKTRQEEIRRYSIQRTLSSEIDFKNSRWPSEIVVDQETYQIHYTFNEQFQNYAKKLIGSYKTDYVSVVVLDNNTGEILVALDHQGRTGEFGAFLTFSSTHPAASLFKVVTASALLEKEVFPEKEFYFKGRGSTLYRYQLRDPQGPWRRRMSLREAFALSNNVIFGRAAQDYLSSAELSEMARRWGFNREIMGDLNLTMSAFESPSTDYDLAEKASGFNLSTLTSPVHAAMFPMIVVNDGVFTPPRVVSEVIDKESGETISLRLEGDRIFSPVTAQDLKSMMGTVVKKGTARSSFRRMNRKLSEKLDIGGKTGSITGGIPDGKRDWFTSYAKPVRGNDKGISVCVMSVNQKKWYVRSAFLAKELMEYYYTNINPLQDSPQRKVFARN